MQTKYQPLFTDLRLNNGVVLHNRIAMCPMLIFAAQADGTPSAQDCAYFQLRNEFGQLLITGATTIAPHIQCAQQQMSLDTDAAIPAFRQLATVMQAQGNKGIVQLQHPGRQASIGYAQSHQAYAPTALDFPFLDYPVQELTNSQIEQIIQAFGQATARAIAAGFSGVEIHGANHYLLQQFFSQYSNRRTDAWGGSLTKRMAFPLAVAQEVLRVARQLKPDFIVGYRLSPEEIHGANIGYTIDESLQLIEQLAQLDLDYLHTSIYSSATFRVPAYKAFALRGNRTKPMNALIHDQIAGRSALMVSGSIRTPAATLDGLNYGDLVALGVVALSDPQFTNKIRTDHLDQINLNVHGREQDLQLPPALIQKYRAKAPLPPVLGLSK